MRVFNQYHICRTGKLEQFYTLYITKTVTCENFCNETCYFVQNLAFDEEKAISTVEAMIKTSGQEGTIDFHDSKRREYCDLKAFGFEWKKTEKGFIAELSKYIDFYGIPANDLEIVLQKNARVDSFWTLWREKKSLLKDAGFSVFKSDNGPFKLFFKNCPDSEMYEKMALLDTKVEEKGQYVGVIGDKINAVTCKIDACKTYIGTYGDVTYITFIDDAGHKYATKYTGTKYSFCEDGDFKSGNVVVLSGTIKGHELKDAERITAISRINIVKSECNVKEETTDILDTQSTKDECTITDNVTTKGVTMTKKQKEQKIEAIINKIESAGFTVDRWGNYKAQATNGETYRIKIMKTNIRIEVQSGKSWFKVVSTPVSSLDISILDRFLTRFK